MKLPITPYCFHNVHSATKSTTDYRAAVDLVDIVDESAFSHHGHWATVTAP